MRRANVSALFDPPFELSPAEFQYLFGGVSSNNCLAAGVIYLAQKGFVSIREDENNKKRIYEGPRVSEKLLAHHDSIVSVVSKHSKGVVFEDFVAQLHDETRGSYHGLVQSVLEQKNIIIGRSVREFFTQALKRMLLLLCGFIVIPAVGFFIIAVFDSGSADTTIVVDVLILLGFSTLVASIPFYAASVFIEKYHAKYIGRRWMSSSRLDRSWSQVLSFHEYVLQVSKQQVTYTSDDIQQKAERQVLPYAIALNIDKKWRDLLS